MTRDFIVAKIGVGALRPKFTKARFGGLLSFLRTENPRTSDLRRDQAKRLNGALFEESMRAVTEDYPALVTHWMPEGGRPHYRSLDCWCNPRPENHQAVGSSTVKHHLVAGTPYKASLSS